MIDNLLVEGLTAESFVNLAGSYLLIPILSVFFFISSIVFLGVGLKQVKQSRNKFINIWTISFIINLALFIGILILIIIFPNTLIKLINIFVK